jgi:carbon-monoxide dehydrogenase small subunit
LYLNGERKDLVVDPHRSLLQLLRDDLQLTGTKEGCGTGYCGACTVLVDGKAVNSCLYLAVDADHREVTTIEGLAAEGGALHPLQQAFIEHGALQCGFCTPGMILAAAAYLAQCPQPQEDDVRGALAGNLCRCTGYRPIVRAVLAAAEKLRAPGGVRPSAGRPARPKARA